MRINSKDALIFGLLGLILLILAQQAGFVEFHFLPQQTNPASFDSSSWNLSPERSQNQQQQQNPPVNPSITLDVSPDAVQREQTVIIRISSTFPNSQAEIQFQYDQQEPWMQLGYAPLDRWEKHTLLGRLQRIETGGFMS